MASRARPSTPIVLPGNQHDFDFEFLGLIALEDPVRPDVPQAIAECHAAGIRVVMMTGDHPVTAISVARQVGLPGDGAVITGAELAALSDDELRARLADTHIFCRVQPEQKLRLVQAFRARGDVVAMTGDGVNDAPALKAAHIGVAMGARGTDVAREAAALVLLNDDFASLVTAVRYGRRVFANLRKAIVFVVAVHVPIVGLSIVPVVIGLADAADAGAHPVPATDHRPGLLSRIRGRAARSRCHESTTAPSEPALVRLGRAHARAVAGNRLATGAPGNVRGRSVRHGLGRHRARSDFHGARAVQPRSNPRESFMGARNLAWPQRFQPPPRLDHSGNGGFAGLRAKYSCGQSPFRIHTTDAADASGRCRRRSGEYDVVSGRQVGIRQMAL